MEIVDATSTSLGPQLVSGRLDLAVVNLPLPDHELVTEPLFSEDLLLFAPPSSPLASMSEVTLRDLVGVELLIPPSGTAFRDLLETTAREQGVQLLPRAELDGLRLIASLAIAGQGTAILPASAVPKVFQVGTKAIPIRGLPRREVGVAHRRRGLPSAAAKAFHVAVRDIVAAEAGPNGHLHLPPD
jgi:LysR family hydrogen peroxide-inducible transcriptional activator